MSNTLDCDDEDKDVSPAATETCDGVDEDCDGRVDEDAEDGTTWYSDNDGDGYGDPDSAERYCEWEEGLVDDDQDCDDTNDEVNPDRREACDGIDNDCDGETDEADAWDAETWWVDDDADGYGDPDATELGCTGAGLSDNDGDCDDGNSAVHPGATETCDGADQNCDGVIDEGVSDAWYPDTDGDGYGDESAPVAVCTTPPPGYVADGGDCDDTDATANPDGTEACDDGVDNDCDGTTEEGCTTWTSYEGWETFDFGFLMLDPADSNCHLLWEAVGSEVPFSCTDCEFTFDVAMTFDSAGSTDDGTCASLATDTSYLYGYTQDYYGYGPYVMYGYSPSAWYAWAPGTFDGSTGQFSYQAGYVGYYYDGYYGYYPEYIGYYFTDYWSGYALLGHE